MINSTAFYLQYPFLSQCLSDLVTQSCPTLCNPMDKIVHGVLQSRMLKSVTIPFSRRSSQPRDQTQISHTAGGFFTSWASREALPMPTLNQLHALWEQMPHFLTLYSWLFNAVCNLFPHHYFHDTIFITHFLFFSGITIGPWLSSDGLWLGRRNMPCSSSLPTYNH